MGIYLCNRCGVRIIFRRRKVHPNGRVEYRSRPFAIHLDGPCSALT